MSQGMNTLLGEVFATGAGSAASHTEEDFNKQANLEFFSALCAQEGINVAELDDATVEGLFKAAMDMQKQAKEDGAPLFPPKSEKEGDKKDEKEDAKEKEAQDYRAKLASAANAEYLEKRAARVKVAEADYMGRVMAHAMVDELGKIKEAMESKAAGEFPFPPKGEKDGDKKDKKDGDEKEGKEKESSASKATALIAAMERAKTASAPTPTAAASTTSNLDELAAYHAIDMLKAAGVDPDVAFKRVEAAYTLGLQESTKVAAAADGQQALQVRALEICEAAGFPVDWAAA